MQSFFADPSKTHHMLVATEFPTNLVYNIYMIYISETGCNGCRNSISIYFSYANKICISKSKILQAQGHRTFERDMSALTIYSDYDFEKRFCHHTLLSKAAVDMSNAIILRLKQNAPHACGKGISHKSNLQYVVYISETGCNGCRKSPQLHPGQCCLAPRSTPPF